MSSGILHLHSGKTRNAEEVTAMPELFLLSSIMAAAVYSDIRTYKVPNSLIAFGLASGCFLKLVLGGPGELLYIIPGVLIPPILCFALLLKRMLGAGDVKLLAVSGIFLGPVGILWAMVNACVLAAVIAVFKLMHGGMARKRWEKLMSYAVLMAAGNAPEKYISELEIKEKKPWLMHLTIPIAVAVLGSYIPAFAG